MKPFTIVTVLFLTLIAVVHLLRLFVFGWQVAFDGTAIPVWTSAIGAVVAGGLAAMLWKESFGWHLPGASK